MAHLDPTDEPDAPTVPARVRTAAYLVGTILGLGVAPALASLGYTPWVGVVAALAGAANALAFGYRPTREL